MFSSLRRDFAFEKKTSDETVQNGSGLHNDTLLENCIKESWSSIRPDATNSSSSPYIGLVVYVLDVSASMSNIKDCLAKSVAATMRVMKAVCPGVAQTVVTYTDFDELSLSHPPVIHAPFSLNWPHQVMSRFLNEEIEVHGGGYMGCETFDVALNFILRELVPAFHDFQKCGDDLTPVLIFNLTDEDMRLSDETGVYGTVHPSTENRRGTFEDYKCSVDSNGECTISQGFYKQRWGVDRPTTAAELKRMLIERNCWLRCLSYTRDKDYTPPGYAQLCKVEDAFGTDNERWQFFISKEDKRTCTYEPILRMLTKHQWCLFNNVLPTFSASTVIKNVDSCAIEEFVKTGKFHEVKPEWNINQAQIDDLKYRIEDPRLNDMKRVVHEGILSSEPYLLVNAFDSAFSLSPLRTQQQARAAFVENKFNSGGNVTSCLVSFVNSVTESMSEDDISKSEFGHCQCKECKKMYQGVKDNNLSKDYYIKLQLGRYLAKTLFEPMIGDKAMLCASAALEHVVSSVYDCVCNWSTKCIEVSKILSDLRNHDNALEAPQTSTCISSDSRKRAYDTIKTFRSKKNEHFDAAHAIFQMLEMKIKESSDDEDEEMENEDDLIIWLYLKDRESVSRRVLDFIKKKAMSPEEFKRFEHPECFEAVKILAANIKVSRSVRDIPTRTEPSSTTRFLAIPVSADKDKAESRKIIAQRANKYFGGDKNVAALTFIPTSSALQMLTNLVDTKYGLTVMGYSGVKSVAAAVSSRAEDTVTNDLLTRLGDEALRNFVQEKRGTTTGLTTERMFLVVLGDGFEGSLADNLSNSITLNHIILWAKKHEVSEDFIKRLEHFLVVRHMEKMDRNGINKGFNRFDVQELSFNENMYFKCDTCGMHVLKNERFGSSSTCIKCIRTAPERVEEFIREKFGDCLPKQPKKSKNTAQVLNLSLSLKFPNWKLTNGAVVDISKEGEQNAARYTILVHKMKSTDRQVRASAANEIIEKRLNPGILHTNVKVALCAVNASDAIPKGGLVHDILEKGTLRLPGAVSLECSLCGVVYKASLLAPSKKQNRRCPWCRAAKKVKAAGKPGLTLLSAMFDAKNEISNTQFLWAIENCVKELKKDEGSIEPDDARAVDFFFKMLKENTETRLGEKKASRAGVFEDMLKTSEKKILVAGYGNVKTKSFVFEEGLPCSLQEKITWGEFNSKVCERLLGYRLDKKWSSWNDFLCAPQKETWEFVFNAASAIEAQGDILEKLTGGAEDYISPASIAKLIQRIV